MKGSALQSGLCGAVRGTHSTRGQEPSQGLAPAAALSVAC